MIDLKNIPGVPPEHADRYGQQFISLSRKYSDEKDQNMSGADAASSPPQPASKAQSSYFKTKDWDVVEIGSSDEESPSINDVDGFIDDDEYDEDWNEEAFEAAAASSGYFGDATTQTQAGPSPARSQGAKRLTGKQLEWKTQFENQATQAAAAAREPPAVARPSKSGAKKATGGRASGGAAWRGGRGGKKVLGKRRSSGTASTAGGNRTKGAMGIGKGKAPGGSCRSGAGGSGSGTGSRSGVAASSSGAGARSRGGGARGGGGSGAIRPMGVNFFSR